MTRKQKAEAVRQRLCSHLARVGTDTETCHFSPCTKPLCRACASLLITDVEGGWLYCAEHAAGVECVRQ